MKDTLKKLITNAELTPKVKHIADYVVDNLKECCFISSTNLAETLGVSYSSVIRMTRLLGFTGYSDFQRFLREIYLENETIINENILVPADRLMEVKKQSRDFPVSDMVTTYVLSNMQKTIAANSDEHYNEACKILLDSNKCYLLSSRGSSCITDFLSVILRQMIPHVYNYSGNEINLFDFVSDLSENDCAIVVSFPRYSKITIKAAHMAQKQGAKIILITNKLTNALSPYADVVFTANSDTSDFYNSYVSGLFVAEMLCAHLGRMINYSNDDILRRINEFTEEIGFY